MGFVDSVRQTLGNVAHFGKICPIVSVKGLKLLFFNKQSVIDIDWSWLLGGVDCCFRATGFVCKC